MSTELVAIERINIKKDNGDADALRSCLAHYLQQFLDSASIESMTLHELTIRIKSFWTRMSKCSCPMI